MNEAYRTHPNHSRGLPTQSSGTTLGPEPEINRRYDFWRLSRHSFDDFHLRGLSGYTFFGSLRPLSTAGFLETGEEQASDADIQVCDYASRSKPRFGDVELHGHDAFTIHTIDKLHRALIRNDKDYVLRHGVPGEFRRKQARVGRTSCALRWLRSFGQFFRFDKWNVCQG